MTDYPLDPDNLPDQVMIVDGDGIPSGVVDIPELQAAATVLMLKFAVAAEDREALVRLAHDWPKTVDSVTAGFTAAAALSAMTENVVAPLLQVVDTLDAKLGVALRDKLAETLEHAEATLGGGK